MTTINQNNFVLHEPENPTVYDYAWDLYQAGFHITILRDNLKWANDKEWNKKHYEPVPEMTGVGLVTGAKNKDGLFVFALDIDIYRPERRETIFQKICNHLNKNLYMETTPSGGYRIIFFCKTCPVTKAPKFDFSEENDCAKHKDNIELFAGLKQIVIAPSRAVNKQGEVGEYKQISEVGLKESAILTEYEMKSLTVFLDQLSHKYSSQKFQHKHSVSQEYQEKIRRVYQYLKSEGYTTGPLYNGERHCSIPDWKNGVDGSAFDTNKLTGIQVKLGKQKDGLYLCCLDIDVNKNGSELPFMVLDQFKPVLGDNFYSEMSVSKGYHVLFKTDRPLDINRKWKLPEGGTIEILWSEHDTINVAPTSSYIKKYKFSGYPEYGTSESLAAMEDIPIIETDAVQNFLNSYTPCRKTGPFKGGNYRSSSAEDNEVEQYMRQYGLLSTINRQIKLIFPDVTELLDYLNIKHSNRLKPMYINFFSLYADDGNNPDAILFHNNNNDPKNKWAGYSVQDFHSGEVLSFGHYLCKYSKDLFDILMKRIGYTDTAVAPVNSNSRVLSYQCGKYISESQRNQILNDINNAIQLNHNKNKQTMIVITAPTGIGKTSMFYKLAEDKRVKMILALSYTSQVLQGKASYSVPGILTGMCQNDSKVPQTGSIFMTYDKSRIVDGEVDASEYIMVIDEAHNLVNHSNFRGKVLQELEHLSDQCRAVVYMTATPEYLNRNDMDLTIKIEQKNLPLENISVCKYRKDAKTKVADALINQHKPGKIDVIYARSKKQLYQMEKLIQKRSIETQVIHSDIKDESEVYNNLSKRQKLSRGRIFKDGGVLLTTNLIIDGINILDQNIGNVYLVDIKSTTDLIQFPSRFRHGFDHYYLFVSGNIPRYVNGKSRQELFSLYFSLALKQKESHDTFEFKLNSFASIGLPTPEIALTDRYSLLGNNGRISTHIIAEEVQKVEARRMNSDVAAIEEFVSEYGYQVTELSLEELINQGLSDLEKHLAHIDLNSKKIDLVTTVVKILINRKYTHARQELVKDYLKKKHRVFKSLSIRWNISKHKSTGKYEILWEYPECVDLLYHYCTGLELNSKNPLKLLHPKYSKQSIYSIRRTYHNLMLEKAGIQPKKDDKFFRLVELRECVREVKVAGVPLVINSQHLLDFARYFNSRYAAVYNENDIKNVAQDLKDIFDVEVVTKQDSGKKSNEYHVKGEWSLNNIHGISFK